MFRLKVIAVFLFVISCSEANNTPVVIDKRISPPEPDKDLREKYEAGQKAKLIDTSTLKGKQDWIMNEFLKQNKLISADYDTLFDLNYDGIKDYIIGYYGQSGTGIKNRVNVYIYSNKKRWYVFDEQLSNLPNPTFYMGQKKITSFYMGNGGGSGARLEWINNKWITTKEFNVENGGDTTEWSVTYPLKKVARIYIKPYQMIPPSEILETNIKL